MEFLKGYMDNIQYRHALNDLTQEIYSFSFEDWYISGYYEGDYIPYSYMKNGEIISNASANIMKMVQNGREKLYIQIGTVMTRPEYRNRGLAGTLISMIIDDYKSLADGFYLYANLNALGFYERQGFCRLDQWRYSQKITSLENVTEPFEKAGDRLLARYRYLLHNAAVNHKLDQRNRAALQLFYTGKMENVYYHNKLDCFAVMHADDRILYLDSVISSVKIPLSDILKHVPMQYDTVVLGFTPEADTEGFTAQKYDGEDDYRFYYMGNSLEEIAEEKLFFPVMSHT